METFSPRGFIGIGQVLGLGVGGGGVGGGRLVNYGTRLVRGSLF